MDKPILTTIVEKFMNKQLSMVPKEVAVPEHIKLLMENAFIEGIIYTFNEIPSFLPPDEDPKKEKEFMHQLHRELEFHSIKQKAVHDAAMKRWDARKEKESPDSKKTE